MWCDENLSFVVTMVLVFRRVAVLMCNQRYLRLRKQCSQKKTATTGRKQLATCLTIHPGLPDSSLSLLNPLRDHLIPFCSRLETDTDETHGHCLVLSQWMASEQ